MRRLLQLVLVVLVAANCSSGCKAPGPEGGERHFAAPLDIEAPGALVRSNKPHDPAPKVPDADLKALADGNREFACALYHELAGGEGNLVTLLRCGRIAANTFTLVDSFTLPFVYGDVEMQDTFIGYLGHSYDYYYPVPVLRAEEEGESVVEPPVREPGYVLGALTLSPEGMFEVKGELNLGQMWSSLLGVRNAQAFITVSGAAVAQCVFGESGPEVLSISPVMGYPGTIRFDAGHAYIPLGYSGVLTLPL